MSAIDEMIISNTNLNSKELKRFIITKRNSSPSSSLPCFQPSDSQTGTTHSIKFNHPTKGDICTSAVSQFAPLTHLVVRGNPRNAKGVSVEFPFSVSDSLEKPVVVRAKSRNSYNQEEQLQYRHEKRSILYKSMVTSGKILPDWVDKKGQQRRNRVGLCRRFMHTHDNAQSFVTLSVDENHTARYRNLIHCDDAWCCPVCSANLLDEKSKEITQVQKNFLKEGGGKNWSTWMLTLTIPHYKQDKLADLLDKKSKVMSDFHAHSAIKKLKARIGWKGYVDSLEVRYGETNGWHPHHHILGFFTNMHPNTQVQCTHDAKRNYYRIATQHDKKTNKKLEKIAVKKYIYHLFAYLCVKHGLGRPSEEYGVDFRKSDDIQDYLTKQSKIALELTKEASKKSGSSRSQWEILKDCEEVKDSENDSKQLHKMLLARELFCEFAQAVKGRAKIHWSPDFKEQYLDEVEEEKGLKEDKKTYVITLKLWNRFFTFSNRIEQRELLEKAEKDSLYNTNEAEKRLLELKRILADEEEREYKTVLLHLGITNEKLTFSDIFSDLVKGNNLVMDST